MYEMTLDGKDFFAPANEKYTFIQLELHEALNDAGYIEAQVPSSNPEYENIKVAQSKVELIKDGKAKFRGKVQDVSVDFSKTKHLYIVGELSYLNESVQLQQKFIGISKAQVLERVLAAHNTQSEEKFYPGLVAINNSTVNALIDYSYTLDLIRDVVCGDAGYIKITYRNGRREIDIVPIEAYGKQSNQYIRFGSNLLDYVEENHGSTIVTAILAKGQKLEESTTEGLDSYLTVAELNGGSPILVNLAGVNTFGYKCRIVDFDTNDVNTLMRLGKAYLTNYQFANLTLRLKAVDLSMVDSSQDDYDMGDYVRATCEPLNMDLWLPVRSKDTNILDLAQNSIDLGLTRSKSLTEATTSGLTNIIEQLPQQNYILSTAQKNATKQILEATTGVITTRNGEQTIADNADITKAVKVWRWNMGGFGYSRNGYNGPYETAITMDGGIVANFINTGEMLANRVRGGDFVIGGSGTAKNGTLYIYSETDQLLLSFDKDNGLVINGKLTASTIQDKDGKEVKVAELVQASVDAAQRAEEALQSEKEAKNSAAESASAAQQAQSAAESARDAAQTAQSAAESAQSGAENARDAAQTAQSAASDAASSASGSASSASSAASSASSAASSASSAATAASSAEAAAKAAQTAAAGSASSAASSASAAKDANTKVQAQMERFIPVGVNPSYYPITIGNYHYRLWGYLVD